MTHYQFTIYIAPELTKVCHPEHPDRNYKYRPAFAGKVIITQKYMKI